MSIKRVKIHSTPLRQILYAREYRKSHKDVCKSAYIRFKVNNPDYYSERSREWRKHNNRHKENRDIIINILGSKCSNSNCLVPGGCTEVRCLEIDHINGDGKTDRKRFSGGSSSIYKYYAEHQQEAKEKLQLLCANCHRLKE